MSTAIWISEGDDWKQLQPVGFEDEKALHDLVEEAPQVLPLSGSPSLAVVGREVRLGSGYADLIAIEPPGRLVILEIKLAQNAEARRAVIAQVLAYAAYLHRLPIETLERDILESQLSIRGFESLHEATGASAQGPPPRADEFLEALGHNLRSGRFRVVLVLDSAPTELVELVGYLEAVAPELTLDLVTVSAYDIQGKKALVPQRIDPERVDAAATPAKAKPTGQVVDGGDEFAQWIAGEPDEQRRVSERIYAWAKELESRGFARLKSYQGPDLTTLMLYAPHHDGSMASAWKGRLYLYRSVFEKVAPRAIPTVEAAVKPNRLGQGTVVPIVNDEVLEALTASYEEAASSGQAIEMD